MTPFRRRILDYTLAALLLALPLVILRAGVRDPGDQSALDRAVLRVSSPIQAAVSWIVEGIGGMWNRYIYLVDVEEENRELRAENLRLREDLAHAKRNAADIQALEDLVLLRREAEGETIGARVISASLNPHLRVMRLRLDRGEGEVDVGMPVIDGKGLVGVVRKAYGAYADVLMITDPESTIEVIAPRTGARGTVAGMASEDSYRCRLRIEKRGGTVEEGDLVVTKDLGAFPAGIAVGKVSRVLDVDYSLYQEVEVEPAVEFASLSRVLVVVAPPPPADPSPTAAEPARSAHRVGAY